MTADAVGSIPSLFLSSLLQIPPVWEAVPPTELHGKTVFVCPFCSAPSSKRWNLQVHITQVHGVETAQRRYHCACGKAFKWNGSLFNHCKRTGHVKKSQLVFTHKVDGTSVVTTGVKKPDIVMLVKPSASSDDDLGLHSVFQ